MPRVLIIDDDEAFRSLLVQVLQHQGYTTAAACDGEEGVRHCRNEPVDLVVTDIVMPNKEGLATVMELRRDYPRMGIIVMSGGQAKDAPLYLQTAANLGADRKLHKPFPMAEFIEAVKEVLAQGGHIAKARPTAKPFVEGWQ